jgi:serine protease
MIFRLVLTAVAAASLSCAADAATKKAKLSAEVAAKSATKGEIAAEIAKNGKVRVVVTVETPERSAAQLMSATRRGANRAAAKQLIANAIDGFVRNHAFSLHSGAKGAPAIMRLTSAPAFSVMVNEKELDALGKDERVVAVEYDRPFTRQLAATLPLIGMPAVHAAGGTGAGYAVAHIDDGIQRNHPFLGVGRIAAEACFLDTNDCPNGSNQQTGTGAAAAAAGASHGTHTAGIAIGNRPSGTPSKGVAPAVKIVPINIFGPNDSTSFSTIQRAFEYVEDLVLLNNGANPHKIASLNMSVGGGASSDYCDSDPTMALLKTVVDSLRAKGVLPVVSSGNGSSTNGISYPACISTMVSVAATSRAGVVSSYTDISRTTDFFAPGGEIGDCVVSSVPSNAFGSKCGTSMAAPHIAGAAAVLKQIRPAASACRIEEALKMTGLPTADTRAGGLFTKPRIRVDRARARLLAPTAPPNNDFATATVIPATANVYSVDSTNVTADREVGERHHVVPTSERSVWWKWTPTTRGLVTIDTLGSGFDTVLAVYAGASSAAQLGALVAYDDDISGAERASRVSFIVGAGQTYHIVVAGKTTYEQCSITLNLNFAPANDNFVNAQPVAVTASSRAAVEGSNMLATQEPGEPSHDGLPGATASVWYKFTAPVSGPITIDTEGSTTLTDTVLAVYRGSAVHALTRVASDDDSGTNLLSSVTFNMTQGAVYRVAVAGFGGAQGRFRLRLTPAGAQQVDRGNIAITD